MASCIIIVVLLVGILTVGILNYNIERKIFNILKKKKKKDTRQLLKD